MTLRRGLLIAGGVLATALGVVGLFVPILPTTPFLLLAAAAFARSSERLHRWLLGHRLFGAYLRAYREHRAMTSRARAITLALLWAGLTYAACAHAPSWWLRGVLAAIGLGVTLHLLTLRTYTREMAAAAADDSVA
ncbi:MAG: YbaN family protein [Anaerolineae bacterium]|jgi:uncharacterized membrane protein YbaN (DUF454 family)